MAVKIVYGKSKETGEIVHISTVERGLSCNCVCPACGEDLVMKGIGVRPYFAHKSDVDGTGSNCETAVEAIIRYLVTETFKGLKQVYLHLPTGVNLLRSKGIELDSSLSIPEAYKMWCDIKEVHMEEPISALGVVPDVTIVTDKCTIYVEIYVTHKAPKSKIKSYAGDGRLAIELDLSQFKDKDYLYKADIKAAIDKYVFLHSISHYINNPISKRLNCKLYRVKTTGKWLCFPFDFTNTGLNSTDFNFCKDCRNMVAYKEKNGRYWSYCIKNIVSSNQVESFRHELEWALGPNDVLYNMEFGWSYTPDETKKDNEGERYRQWKKSSKK